MLCPLIKGRYLLHPVKVGLGLHVPGIYQIPCMCGKVYIGQVVSECCAENIRLNKPDQSGLAEHVLTTRHEALFDGTMVLWGKSGIRE